MIELHLHLDGSLSAEELGVIKQKFYRGEEIPFSPCALTGAEDYPVIYNVSGIRYRYCGNPKAYILR